MARVAALDEPGLPAKGAASTPKVLRELLEPAGFEVHSLTAAQLADPAVFNRKAFDLLVVPTGESFPEPARDAVVVFLHSGGSLITTGGYAFNHLLVREGQQWRSAEEVGAERLAAATQKGRSLLANGDFERPEELAEPMAETRAWRRSSPQAQIVADQPQEGLRCGRIHIEGSIGHVVIRQDVAPPAGGQCVLSGWIRTQDVRGPGKAYLSVYQYAADGRLVTFGDYANTRGTVGWTRSQIRFGVAPGVTRLEVSCGIYQAAGTAWFDDIRLADLAGVAVSPMNTSNGRPADGLVVRPEQIGVFDPTFPLKRVAELRGSPGQHLVGGDLQVAGPLGGWAACGVTGTDNARWVPLLDSLDRYGRQRGAAAAMLLHYNGYFAGSSWVCFGVDSRDLFDRPDSPTAKALPAIAEFLTRKVFLRNLVSDHRLYRPGEPVTATVQVDNRGAANQAVQVEFQLIPEGSEAKSLTAGRKVTVAPGTAAKVTADFPPVTAAWDLYRITAVLSLDGRPIDEMSSGFVVDSPKIMRSGPVLRFRDNYFTLNGRPMFLFGSDTYVYTYNSAPENPLTWAAEHRAARDVGLSLYENLQYISPGTGMTVDDLREAERLSLAARMTDDDWRSFRGMSQLTQAHGLVFMPGMLIGHNVAIGGERLAGQSEMCAAYAKHLSDTPGLLYYINGDYQMRPEDHPAGVNQRWRDWLTQTYGSGEALRQAWAPASQPTSIEGLTFPPLQPGAWDDRVQIDRARFLASLTRTWNQAHVGAIRAIDREHPITSEYYQFGWAGMDLRTTIDGQDVSNFGFFSEPEKDLDILPLKIRGNDLRVAGKGVSLGEYGVKTHPAWEVANGGDYYHIRRSEAQQQQLFMTVAHYALGLGASKVQNWCLRDAQTNVFPWGIFYPNQMIPKDVGYTHRNLSMVWRQFTPRYEPAPLTVCMPTHLRTGPHENLGWEVADRCFEALLGLHQPFNVVDDFDLQRIPQATRVLVYPAPFALDDSTFGRLIEWVRGGGTLLVTGDFSYDADRKRTRANRMVELAGVEWVEQMYADVERSAGVPATMPAGRLAGQDFRPCARVRPTKARTLVSTQAGDPLLTFCDLGSGWVYYCTDPVELAANDEPARAIYRLVLAEAGVEPLGIAPDEPWLHVMAQPTATGTVHVAFNRRKGSGREQVRLSTAAGEVQLAIRDRYPALAAVSNGGAVLALSTDGEAAVDGRSLVEGRGLKLLLSLDGEDLGPSAAILVAPMEPGTLLLPAGLPDWVALVGDIIEGHWKVLEQSDFTGELTIDADRATCLICICPTEQAARWGEVLTGMMQHPDRIQGY